MQCRIINRSHCSMYFIFCCRYSCLISSSCHFLLCCSLSLTMRMFYCCDTGILSEKFEIITLTLPCCHVNIYCQLTHRFLNGRERTMGIINLWLYIYFTYVYVVLSCLYNLICIFFFYWEKTFSYNIIWIYFFPPASPIFSPFSFLFWSTPSSSLFRKQTGV